LTTWITVTSNRSDREISSSYLTFCFLLLTIMSHLPFDISSQLSRFLPVYEIPSLRPIVPYGFPSIVACIHSWRRIAPRHLSVNCLPDSSELRQEVIAACRLDAGRPKQTPKGSETILQHSRICDAKFLAGGKWVLSVMTNAELRLQRPESSTPAFVAPGSAISSMSLEHVNMGGSHLQTVGGRTWPQ